jgi:hypothetical protein
MSSSASHMLLPPITPPPVFLALDARRARVPHTPAIQGIDLRVVRPFSAREKLAMRDVVDVLVCRGEGRRGRSGWARREKRSLSYVGFWEFRVFVCVRTWVIYIFMSEAGYSPEASTLRVLTCLSLLFFHVPTIVVCHCAHSKQSISGILMPVAVYLQCSQMHY